MDSHIVLSAEADSDGVFKCDLADTLVLPDNCLVGVTEVTMRKGGVNIDDATLVFDHMGHARYIRLPGGMYKSMSELCSGINQAIIRKTPIEPWEMQYLISTTDLRMFLDDMSEPAENEPTQAIVTRFDYIRERVEVTHKEDQRVKGLWLSPQLRLMLQLPGVLEGHGKEIAGGRQIQSDVMKLCSTLVQPRMVGTGLERLLRLIHASDDAELGKTINYLFPHVDYCQLTSHEFRSCEFWFRDEQGRNVRQGGKVYIVLHLTTRQVLTV